MAVSAWLWGFTPAAPSRCCTARRRREVRRPGAAPQQCPPRPARPAQSRHRSRLACEVLGVALMACSRRLLCLPAQEACCSDRMGAALPAPHLQRHAGAPPAEVAVGTLLRQWRCGLALEARGASLHSTARVPSASDGNGAPWQATGWWPSTVRGTRHLLTGASCTTQFREAPQPLLRQPAHVKAAWTPGCITAAAGPPAAHLRHGCKDALPGRWSHVVWSD